MHLQLLCHFRGYTELERQVPRYKWLRKLGMVARSYYAQDFLSWYSSLRDWGKQHTEQQEGLNLAFHTVDIGFFCLFVCLMQGVILILEAFCCQTTDGGPRFVRQGLSFSSPGTELSERNWVLGETDASLKGSLLIEQGGIQRSPPQWYSRSC